ncbi:peroxin-3 [Phialemonium atrogriseum]|uniref:Peroxin-3 n=1 Tax=Phialemonium atrogriseum TaxID=1093897 RepID=A0AAJ0C461_9PEZI|nr:peroxin-3 [Phialemonium atrogriseum]KAK1769809.1 peroxin-3 [Phialemonium atrogriseum]
MFAATRRWVRRNRTPLAIGLGVVGAGYVVTQYVLSKINDARERMSSDRIAKENLRRRFEQNQEDCTFTVLALLPTATTNILEAMNTEKITYEIQQMKGSAAARAAKSIGSISPPSISEANATDDDGRSMVSLQSESGVHASQIAVPSPATAAAAADNAGEGADTGEQTAQKPRRTKRQLWDDLTISSITRAYTLIYTLSLLTMLTRIQLNLLGRRSYLSSVVSLATGSAQATISLENNDDDNAEQAYGSDFEVNRKYLTFSWWLLNRGWVDIMQRVEAAVREVFGDLSPRDTLTLETFSALTNQVRRLVEGGSPGGGRAGTQWLPFLLPPPDMEELVLRESGVMDDDDDNNSASRPQQQQQQQQPTLADGFTSAAASATCAASLRHLLDETADLAESPSFAHVHAQLLDAAFSLLLRGKLAQGAFEASVPVTAGDPSSPAHASTSSKAVLLPKVLSVLTRQAHAIGNGMPNEYLREMEAVRDLEGFAAVVYSSNWESEIARDDDVGAGAGSGLGRAAAAASSSSGAGEESLVVVDPTQNFESAWERAAG